MNAIIDQQREAIPEDFVALVRDLRTAQKSYFKTRTIDLLNHCKALESRVDKELLKKAQNANS